MKGERFRSTLVCWCRSCTLRSTSWGYSPGCPTYLPLLTLIRKHSVAWYLPFPSWYCCLLYILYLSIIILYFLFLIIFSGFVHWWEKRGAIQERRLWDCKPRISQKGPVICCARCLSLLPANLVANVHHPTFENNCYRWKVVELLGLRPCLRRGAESWGLRSRESTSGVSTLLYRVFFYWSRPQNAHQMLLKKF